MKLTGVQLIVPIGGHRLLQADPEEATQREQATLLATAIADFDDLVADVILVPVQQPCDLAYRDFAHEQVFQLEQLDIGPFPSVAFGCPLDVSARLLRTGE
jgi:hypothetical protein